MNYEGIEFFAVGLLIIIVGLLVAVGTQFFSTGVSIYQALGLV